MRICRLILIALLSFFATTIHAKNYTFFGTGEWTDANNWTGGLMPWAGTYTNADTITITGTTGVGVNCTFNCPFGTIGSNFATIIVAAGGTFTLQNFTQFSNGGKIIVDGTLINKTTFEGGMGGSIIVNGTFNNQKSIGNQGTLTINNGGVFNNQLTGNYSNGTPGLPGPSIGTLVINTGGIFNNMGTAIFRVGILTNGGTINNSSVMSGTAVITGNLTNAGTLAPGDSPGSYTITGNYTASSTAVHRFEVAGLTSPNYDKLNVTGTVTLSGAMNVTLINGFTPTANHDIPIITGTISGTFTTTSLPQKYVLVYNPDGVVLRYLITLPVNFISLNAEKEGSGAKISWKIENESNLATYEIERSSDGRNFKKIGQVSAANQRQYNFIDAAPDAKSFYRVKSVDRDGKYSYSTIVTYKQGKGFIALSIYPSPANQEIVVQHSTANANSKLTIVAADGSTRQIIRPATATQRTTINLSSLSVGSYIIRYDDEHNSETAKFVKQ